MALGMAGGEQANGTKVSVEMKAWIRSDNSALRHYDDYGDSTALKCGVRGSTQAGEW
jgi:hypothetical protein